MRKAKVLMQNEVAGELYEREGQTYFFLYKKGYQGLPISLTLPIREEAYDFERFPSFFEGLLPEGIQLEGLIKHQKLDKQDYFGQLLATGRDLVGAVIVLPEDE